MSILPRNAFLHATPLVSGHRGGAGDEASRTELTAKVNWAETLGRAPNHFDYRAEWANRLATFDLMTRKGVSSFETDLLPSKDGTPVVVHDSHLGSDNIWDLRDGALHEQGVSTYSQLLDMLERAQPHPGRGVIFNETKGMFSGEHGTDVGRDGVHPISKGLMEAVVDELEHRVGPEHGWTWSELPVIGFSVPQISYAKELNPNVEIGLSYGRESFDFTLKELEQVRQRPDFLGFVVQRMIDDCKRTGAFGVNLDTRFIDRRLVDALHDEGLAVNSWASFGITEPRAQLTRDGVDSLITDYALEANAELAALRRPS